MLILACGDTVIAGCQLSRDVWSVSVITLPQVTKNSKFQVDIAMPQKYFQNIMYI